MATPWRRRFYQWFEQSNLLVTTLASTAMPFVQADWPNPRVPSQPQENRGFIRGANVQLIGQDQFFGAAGQAPVYDWPNPPVRPRSLTVFNYSNMVLGAAVPAPFSQSDWPNPPRRNTVQPDLPPNLLTTTFFVPPAAPFYQTDWPLPQRQRYPILSDPPNLLTTVDFVAPPSPFYQLDWPNPQRPRYPIQPESPPNLLTTLFVFAPFHQVDWPNPMRPRYPIITDPPNLLTTTFYVAPAPPFHLTEWPLPLRPRYPIQPEPPPNLLTTTTYVAPPEPFYQLDWPLPMLPRQPQENQFFVHGLNLELPVPISSAKVIFKLRVSQGNLFNLEVDPPQ